MAQGDGTEERRERIARRLSRAGVASRRDAERMIADGRVSVNGRRIESPALDVTPADRIEVDGKPLPQPEPARLWLYHKPAGLVTSARDEKGRPGVFDSLPDGMPRVMSVGRLDLTSEGLLLLTNDGALKRRLELPSTGWLRRYRVRVNGTPDDAMLEPLRQGLQLDGERFQPMQVELDRIQGANAWLTVALREGRNREVRRALQAVGLQVNRLIRISYGPFRLGTLEPGAVEEVKPQVLKDQIGSIGMSDSVKRSRRKSRPRKPAAPRETPGEATAVRPDRPRGDGLADPSRSFRGRRAASPGVAVAAQDGPDQPAPPPDRERRPAAAKRGKPDRHRRESGEGLHRGAAAHEGKGHRRSRTGSPVPADGATPRHERRAWSRAERGSDQPRVGKLPRPDEPERARKPRTRKAGPGEGRERPTPGGGRPDRTGPPPRGDAPGRRPRRPRPKK